MTDIKITCWGPRGSLPSPSKKGFNTTEFGGNTSCYHVEAGPFSIILDCGSGIRDLGNHDATLEAMEKHVRHEAKTAIGFDGIVEFSREGMVWEI